MRGYLCLLLTAFLWGTTFVAQRSGMDEIGPFTYGMGRYIIGFFVVLLIWKIMRLYSDSKDSKPRNYGDRNGSEHNHSGWKYGLGAGCIMFAGSAFQQAAMLFTTAGKTAFITCLYIVFVPLFAKLLGQRIRTENWLGAAAATAGLYLLSVEGSMTLNYGDVLAFIGSLFWTMHILFIDRYAPRADVMEISAAQLGVCAILNTIFCFALETFTMETLLGAAEPILYAAVLSSGVAFTLQIVGQKTAEPAPAAIIMSLESVFGALGGWLILDEVMHGAEILGCVLMLAGMLITQAGIILKNVPLRRRKAEG